MANFGDIAAGVGFGLNQTIKSIGEVQRMKMMEDQAERDQNVFDSWKRKEEEKRQPIFLDNLPVKLGDNVKNKLMGLAEMEGLINRTPDGRSFVRKEHGEKLLSLVNSPALLSEQMADLDAEKTNLESLIPKAKENEIPALQAKLQGISKQRDSLSMQSKEFADMVANQRKLKLLEDESAKKQIKTFEQVKGQIVEGMAGGKSYPEPLLKLLGLKDDQFAGAGGGVIFDKKTGKPTFIKPERAEKAPKLTGNIGMNPATGKEEYLLTDGSFSGTEKGTGIEDVRSNNKQIQELRKDLNKFKLDPLTSLMEPEKRDAVVADFENQIADLQNKRTPAASAGGGGGAMSSMPPAAQHKGRIIKDTATGKRYQSNGSAWVGVK